jgi:5-methylthioribose kinase
VLHVDADQHVLVLEDLGECERLDAALRRGADLTRELGRIAAFLGRVHEGTRGADLASFPDGASDDGVLRLHLEHIFRLPFAPNDFPLSPALRVRARELAADAPLRESIAALDRSCREPNGPLIHGDVQPTNVLLAASGVKLLDAEIAHRGNPHFDVGPLVGHLALAALARGRPADACEAIAATWDAYREARGAPARCDFGEVAALAGVEMLRRTLGAARVPEVADDAVALEARPSGPDHLELDRT